MSQHENYFYDKPIIADCESDYIKQILKKYKNERVDEDLRKKIWEELQYEKHLGNISIPFKVVIRRDEYGRYPEFVEVILDTKL